MTCLHETQLEYYNHPCVFSEKKKVLLSSYFQKYKATTCQQYGIFLCDGSYVQSCRIEQLDLMVMILACIQEEPNSDVSWVIHSLSTVLFIMPVACVFRHFTCHLNSLCVHAFLPVNNASCTLYFIMLGEEVNIKN